MHNLNLFSTVSIVLGSSCLILSGLIYFNAKERTHRLWSLFNATVGVWGVLLFFAGQTNNRQVALFLWKLAHIGVIFIAVFFYHFIIDFCKQNKRKILLLVYGQALTFSFLLLFSNSIINSVAYRFNSFFYYVGTKSYFFMLFAWCAVVYIAFRELYKQQKKVIGLKLLQLRYLFYGSLIGFLSGPTTVFPAYVNFVYPAWHGAILIYALIVTYAIFRYRLLDIKIVLTRAAVFVIVYSMVLGMPFGLATFGKNWLANIWGQGWFWVPMISLLILATVGPFIYLFLQHKAEDRLLKEERKIQQFLMQASAGMTTIRDLKKLLNLIIHLLSNTLKLNNAAIYLLEPSTNQYILKATRFKRENPISIDTDDPLIQWFKQDKSPLVYEEIKIRADMETNNHSLKEITSQMKDLSASVIVPTAMQETLLGFLILGERHPSRMYTTDLLNALAVLSNQAALAIENAIFYEETGKTLAERFHESRLRSLGALGTGIAHQMLNRFNVITLKGSLLLEILKSYDFEKLPPEKLQEFKDKFVSEVEKMITSAERGTEITDAIKNYSKADAKPTVTYFKKVVSNGMELLLLKHPHFKFEFVEDYPQDVILWVNFSTLQEVIFNAIDNSCDAMVLKQKIIEDKGLDIKDYKPCVTIKGRLDKTLFEFEIEDNGIGMTEDQLKHGIETAFFTTKGATKGTGMGFPMMRQFVKQNKGDMRVESRYQEWTKIIISLPLAAKEQIEQSQENKDGNK